MPCEICGSEKGPFLSKIVEGASLRVCSACASQSMVSVKVPVVSSAYVSTRRSFKPLVRSSSKPMSEGFVVVPKLGDLIRHEREKRGWTNQDLATRLKVKESFLLKIEHGQIVPNDSTLDLIEKVLEVKTRVTVSFNDDSKKVISVDSFDDSPKVGRTLEDIFNAQLKQKKK